MTRGRRIGLAAAAALTVIVLVGVASLRALMTLEDVPTLRVTRQGFERRVTAEGILTAVKATPLSPPLQAEGPLKIAWLAPDGSHVSAGEVIVRFDPTDKEKELADGRDDRDMADRRIAKKQAEDGAALRDLDRDAESARLDFEQAHTFQSKDPDIFSRVEIIESEIDETLAGKRVDHATSARETRGSLSRTDVNLLAIERQQAEMKMRQGQEGLRSLEMTAPHGGILIYRRDGRGNTPRVGDSIWAGGQPLAEIPELDEMQAEVYVLEADAGGLSAGLSATVALEAQLGTRYAAKIKRVDTLARPRFRGTPVQYFSLTLEIERTDPAVMKPGQRVSAALVLESRDAVLVVPRQAVADRDGHKVVWRKAASGVFEPVEVTLGPSGLGRVVIETGVEPGDEIALRDPTGNPDGDEADNAGERRVAPASPGGGAS